MKAVLIFFSTVLDMPMSGILNLSGYLHMHSVQELLHVNVTTTDEDNETMFCHIQEFIVKSKRFL